MPGAAASPFAFLMIMIWWVGVVLLGVALAYAVVRAGSLRHGERARLDQVTKAMVDEDTRARALPEQQPARSTDRRSAPLPGLPGLFIVPGAVACLAIALMIVATALSPGPANQATTTTGRATDQAAQNQPDGQEQPVQAPVMPGNQPGSDSGRGNKEPLTKRN